MKMRRVSNIISSLFVLVVVAALAIHAYGSFTGGRAKAAASSAIETGTVQVAMKGLAYPNGNRTVAVGTTVVWTNFDGAQHTVTAADHSFTSAKLNKGQIYSHTFKSIGKYDYTCTIHPFMTASITVVQPYGTG